MAYTKTTWEDLPSTNTPLSAANLNKIENELALLDPAVPYTTGSGTINATYVDAAENNHYEKTRNVVSYAFTITAKGTWAANTSFISGLPRPVANVRFSGVNAARDVPFRAAIFTDGTIRNAYSQTTPTAGDRLEGQITYITTD